MVTLSSYCFTHTRRHFSQQYRLLRTNYTYRFVQVQGHGYGTVALKHRSLGILNTGWSNWSQVKRRSRGEFPYEYRNTGAGENECPLMIILFMAPNSYVYLMKSTFQKKPTDDFTLHTTDYPDILSHDITVPFLNLEISAACPKEPRVVKESQFS